MSNACRAVVAVCRADSGGSGTSWGYGRGTGGLPGTKGIVCRNATSQFVVWRMDQAGNRSSGLFTSPSAPSPNPTA